MKRLSVIALAAVAALSLGIQTMELEISHGAEEKPIYIFIEEEQLEFSENDGLGVPFVDENGRTQVPIRKPLEAVGAKVDYRQETREVYIEKGNTQISIFIDGDMYVNGEKWLTDTSAVIVDSRTYMPIRFAFEALDYRVWWVPDGSSDSIYMNSVTWSDPAASPVMGMGMGNYKEIGLIVVPNKAVLPGLENNDNTVTVTEFNQLFGRTVQAHVFSQLSDTAITLEEFRMVYEIYKIEDGVEKQVFSYTFPVCGGAFPIEGSTSCIASLPQWDDSQITTGQYIVKFSSPQVFRYTKAIDGKTYELNAEDCSSNGLSFTVQVI